MSLKIQTLLFSFGVLLLTIITPEWSVLMEGLGFLCIILGLALPLVKSLQNNMLCTAQLQPIHWCAFAITLYLIASVFWSAVHYDSLLLFKNYALFFIIILCGGLLKSKIIDYDLLLKIIFLSGFVISIYSLYKLVVGETIYPGMANGPFQNPNSLAAYLGLCTLITFHFFTKSPKAKMKWIYGIGIITFTTTIILTNSRTTYIALPLAIIAMAWIAKPINFKMSKAAIYSICTGLILTCLAVIMIAINTETNLTLASTFNTDTLPMRFHMWYDTVNAALATNPLFGQGIGTFKSIYPHFRSGSNTTAGLHPHNDFIHLFFELGLIGICFVVIFLFFVVKNAIASIQNDRYSASLPIAILLFCGMTAMMTPVILLTSIMILAALCVLSLIQDQQTPISTEESTPLNRQKMSIIGLVFFAFLCIQNTASEYMMHNVRSDLRSGDLPGFLEKINMAETLSLNLNPHVAVLQAAAVLTMAKQNMFQDASETIINQEVETYIKRAETRNPYNSEIYYYRALLSEKTNTPDQAVSYLKQALNINPRYVAARLKLFELTSDPDDAYSVLRDGLHERYWISDPLPLYTTILSEAQKREDPTTSAIAYRKIQSRLRLN